MTRPGAQVLRAQPWRPHRLLPVGLLALAAAIYQPAWHGGLLWDDPAHITKPELRSLEGLWRIWFDLGATQQYYPLLHSAFWLQWQLWGDAVLGYHLVTIALHAVCAFLVASLLARLQVPGAPLAALLFAVHPIHVESVAWITELKNTLSTTFFLLAALAYVRWDLSRRTADYALALALFVCALLTKTVTATLPAALLVLFWWQRGQVTWRDVRPLVPFFVLGVVAGLTTAWVERTLIGAEGAEFAFSPVERVLIAGRAFWFYLGTLAWPVDLTFIYPRWEVSEGVWWQYLYPAAALGLVVVLWAVRRRSRAPLAAALLYGGLLFPVLGFFNVFPFRYSFVADHFAYLPSIPVLALAAAAAAALATRVTAASRGLVRIALAVPVLALALLSWRQAHDYASAEALYRATLARNPSAWLAHNNLALILLRQGQHDDARRHFEEAVRLNPLVAEHHANLGRLLLQQGAIDEAIARLDAALAVDPDLPNVHSDKGVALLRAGRIDEALAQFDRALALAPQHPEAAINRAHALRARGVARMQAGERADGIADLTEAARLQPQNAEFRNDLGVALLVSGRVAEAVAEFEAALRVRPDFPEARANLARARAER
ncbi:MAG TPA: tetratricopeptide repeat protein [Vicinamibacterales bacterium]|nr:tetratricopeptide repeat protein [Vicinamibacterales bacterium]